MFRPNSVYNARNAAEAEKTLDAVIKDGGGYQKQCREFEGKELIEGVDQRTNSQRTPEFVHVILRVRPIIDHDRFARKKIKIVVRKKSIRKT